ncbi:Transcription factor VHR1 [Yarrowia sp. B02]|nr:Transcription factor VHR1 [Yarrowia sp. B02]
MTEKQPSEHGAATQLSTPFSKPAKLPSMLTAISKTPEASPLSGDPSTTESEESGDKKAANDSNASQEATESANSSFTPQNAKSTTTTTTTTETTTPLAPKQGPAQPTSPENTEDKKKGGVTQSIREKLNFQDEKLWKRFSSRRLDLIDSMALSSKKASEQDVEISNVANTLREEYGYPPETAADFDRLVRAGIQSVRRNRKRVPRFKRSSHVVSQGHHPQRVNFLAAMAGPMHPHHPPAHDHVPNGVTPPNMSPVKRHRSEEDASVALQSLRYQQAHSQGSRTTLPSVTSLSLGIPAEHLKIACDRFLSFVARSHSGKEPQSSNLEALGRGLLESAVAFMLERHQPKEKQDGLREKLLSEPTTAHVVQTLNLRPQPGSLATPFFHNLIGGCAKDFGFDAIVHALGNIYLELVPQYAAGSVTPHAPPRFGPTLPGYKAVTFRFMDKKMDFSFSVNETPPTLYELLENGIKTFHIMVEDKVLHIRSHEDRELVKSDFDVKMVFSRPSVDVEFFFPLLPTPNATNMRYMDSPSFQKLL